MEVVKSSIYRRKAHGFRLDAGGVEYIFLSLHRKVGESII